MREKNVSNALAKHVPYLRRCARAMTGGQATGDAYAVKTLETILADTSVLNGASSAKVALFRVFHDNWANSGSVEVPKPAGLEGKAQERLSSLTKGSREALILTTLEQFSDSETAEIMRLQPEDVTQLLETAVSEMQAAVAGRVLVIEDEMIIAMDISSIVTEMGHDVVGNARTRNDAVALAKSNRPDLVLADIQLADNSSGIDAIKDILEQQPDTPIIFITAFPERFLTGKGMEPAFLITKPYSEDQVKSAVSQAMFFSSTATLTN